MYAQFYLACTNFKNCNIHFLELCKLLLFKVAIKCGKLIQLEKLKSSRFKSFLRGDISSKTFFCVFQAGVWTSATC